MNLVLLVPVYNDWPSVALLIRDTDHALARGGRRARILIVDDGSDQQPEGALTSLQTTTISGLDILHLRSNLGHQRAIAVGLAYTEASLPCNAVVVLDGDGEDRPEDIDRLLKTLEAVQGRAVVFAERTRRSEGLLFASLYWLYRTVHWLLTGERVRVGNFAAIPSAILARLVVVSALWNHFAAAVFHARIPYTTVPTSRGTRYSGRSQMNFVALVTHGLSAMSVFGDRIGVRLLVTTCILMLVVIVPASVALGWQLTRDVPLPAWAPYGAALLVVLVFQTASIILAFVFIILAGRASPGFVPLRDYGHYVLRVTPVPLQCSDVTPACRQPTPPSCGPRRRPCAR
jgi:hypothetical protein